jgi:hypothetical protein
MELKLPMHLSQMKNAMLMHYAGLVSRTHVVPEGDGYLIGQHSWNMQILYLSFCTQPRVEVMAAIAVHDVPELWTGDMPAPTKNAVPALKHALDSLERHILVGLRMDQYHEGSLLEWDREWLKACDICDLLLWAKRKAYNGGLVWDELIHNALGAINGKVGEILLDRANSGCPAGILELYDAAVECNFGDVRIWT